MSKDGGKNKNISWDDPVLYAIVIAAFYLGCKILWSLFHTNIVSGYVHIRYLELWLVNVAGELTNLPLVEPIHKWVQEICKPEKFGACSQDFSTVGWGFLTGSSVFFNLFWLLLLLYWSIRMYLKVIKTHPNLKFSKAHNIKSFVKENETKYPHLKLFSKLDLISTPLDDDIYGMSLTSRQFAFKNRLIKGWKEDGEGSFTPILDREMAIQIFRDQLGKHWVKSTEMLPSETILVAIAMPRVAATDPSLDDSTFKEAMGESNKLIGWAWDQFSKGKPLLDGGNSKWMKPDIDLKYPRSVISKYIGHIKVQKVLEQHAYIRTVIYALYMQARRLGVLPPSEMRWMRYYDRELWYLLQTIGRQAGYAEAAAVLSHYLYESMAAAAIVEPQLDKAVMGLETAMTAFQYTLSDKKSYEKA